MEHTQEIMIWIAGLLHFGILIASFSVPRVLDWRKELAGLSDLSRHVVWVHGVFIVLVIVGFGLIGVTQAASLTAGTPLARCVCGFIAVFWSARLAIQLFLFDARPYLRSAKLRVGYHGLTAVFTYLGFVFAWSALAPAGRVLL